MVTFFNEEEALQTNIPAQFSIKFIDFAQRRKVGFRGAFEFDKKRVLLASSTEIRILGYF